MSPLRWDVLLVGFVLALPVLALGLRGDLSAEEVAMRIPWCLAAGWVAVALLRFASTPRMPAAARSTPAAAGRTSGRRRALRRRLTHRSRAPAGVVPAPGVLQDPRSAGSPRERRPQAAPSSTDRPRRLGSPPAEHDRGCVTDLPEFPLHLRRDAVRRRLVATTNSAGWSAAGELDRLRRGAYVLGTLPADAAASHRLLVRATLAGLRRPAVVSHQSAAVLHGLPLWDVPLDRVHVTRRPRAWNDVSGVLHVPRRPAPGRRNRWRSTASRSPTRCARRSTSPAPCRTRPPSSRSTRRCTPGC